MSPQHQQAIILPSARAPFALGSRGVPAPAKGEVLIKILSAGLNPMSWSVSRMQRDYNFLIPDEFPTVLGSDLAGVVEALGEGVEGFAKGDRVFAQSLSGAFQQYFALPAAALIRIPESTTFDEAATFPITFATACVGLLAPAPIGLALNPTFSWDKPQQGESALVIAAATSVGQFAIQLLRFLGFTRIVAYASKAHFSYLTQLGATACIDRAEVPLDALPAHPALTPPVKVVYDTIGQLNTAYDCVSEGGCVATSLPHAALDREGKNITLVRVQGYYVGPDHTAFGRLIIKNLPEMLEKGVVVPNRVEVLPNGLAGIVDGLERMKKGGVSGVKLVAHPQDPVA
ncbi:chaperonin 10-like protein [Mycena belliarum]|uniref:Chaperonin 10-like protein n=1 Tax=Mycena belliarum TaxID=1033014 RepID=A0AAD6UCB2_9AGAR|nr:chaperonin 10-like protein [Mycena belliae]